MVSSGASIRSTAKLSAPVASTVSPRSAGAMNRSDGIGAGKHAYSVVSVFTSGGTTYVRVRNPWGVDSTQGSRDGSDDGYVTLSWAAFRLAFSSIVSA